MPQDFVPLIESLRVGFGGLVAAAGVLVLWGGGIGLMRFPDFYTRLHAAGATDTVGAVITLAGLALMATDGVLALKLALLAVLLAAMAPTLTQVLANAAHAAGLAPIAGKYVAPRPGARERGE